MLLMIRYVIALYRALVLTIPQPISIVDSEHFWWMVLSLNLGLFEKDIPHRTAIHDCILKCYKQEREQLKQQLKVCGLIANAGYHLFICRWHSVVSH